MSRPDLEPTPDIRQTVNTLSVTIGLLVHAVEVMSEELRQLREAAQNDDGVNQIADELKALREQVDAAPDAIAGILCPLLKSLQQSLAILQC